MNYTQHTQNGNLLEGGDESVSVNNPINEYWRNHVHFFIPRAFLILIARAGLGE